jgi:dsRNA-specific ribonuclease
LSSIAQEYKINDHVIYDKERIANLEHIVYAQAVRALVGAVYLDSGMDQTVSWLTQNFLPEIDKKVEKICEENAERKKAVSSSN